jgi:hypothetical protein
VPTTALWSTTWVASTTHVLAPGQVVDLMMTISVEAVALGITGLLVYHDGTLIHSVEGTADAVDAMGRRDRARFRNLVVMRRAELRDREFATWAMSFRPPVSAISEVACYSPYIYGGPVSGAGGSGAARLLETFRRNLRAG